MIADLQIHASRADGGCSHMLFLFGGHEGYLFTMDAIDGPSAMSFHAVSDKINPNTGKIGFGR